MCLYRLKGASYTMSEIPAQVTMPRNTKYRPSSMRKPAREAVQSSSYHNFVRAGIPVVPKLPERDEDDFVTLPSSQGWSAGAPLPTSVSETPAKSRDDIGEQGADKKDTGAMSPESESGPDDRGDSKTVEEVARVEANSSSVEQGPAVAQEQRLEDPPFIQVGEKVCFSTVVKAVLIPSIEDMPQGEKNHIWWHGRDYMEFRKNYERFLTSPSSEDDPDWPEQVPTADASAVDVTVENTEGDGDDVARAPTPTAGAVLIVDAATAVPTSPSMVPSVPLPAPPYGYATAAGFGLTPGTLEKSDPALYGKLAQFGNKTVGCDMRSSMPKGYEASHVDFLNTYHHMNNNEFSRYPGHAVNNQFQQGGRRGRAGGMQHQHGGQQQAWYAHPPLADARGYVPPLAPPVTIARFHGQPRHLQRPSRRSRSAGARGRNQYHVQPNVNSYNRRHDDRPVYGGVTFGYGPPTVVLNSHGMDCGFMAHGGAAVVAPPPRVAREVCMPEPPRYCMWRGPAMFPGPVVHTMQ